MDVKVDYIHNGNYWDGPLSGTLRARGHYYHFDLAFESYWRLSDDADEGGTERFHRVYRLLVGTTIWPLDRIYSKSETELFEEWKAGVLAEHSTAVFR